MSDTSNMQNNNNYSQLGCGPDPYQDFSTWEVGPEYQLIKMVGQGSYGRVAQAKHIPTGVIVAIKRMDDIFGDTEDCKKMVREVLLLKAMNTSDYVTKLLDIIEPRDITRFKDLYIVIEYMDADLKKVMKGSLVLSDLHIQVIVFNLLCALNFIHSAHILHRDIKPSNILIDEDCHIKLCDFGLARSYSQLVENPTRLYEEIKSKIEYINIQRSEQGQGIMSDREVKQLVKIVLDESKEARGKLQRKLSDHVVTRWYRPPEIILIEKQYGPAIDIWGVGCVMAELFQKTEKHMSDKTTVKNQPLFPGKSCFPLSPDKNAKRKRIGSSTSNHTSYPVSEQDQLQIIIDVLGSPTEEDLSFITDKAAVKYIQELGKDLSPIDLNELFPYADPQAVDLLKRMISFNPYVRPTVEECLCHPYFENITRSASFTGFGRSSRIIDLIVDKEDIYYSFEDLFKIITNEIQFFKQKRMAQGPSHILFPLQP